MFFLEYLNKYRKKEDLLFPFSKKLAFVLDYIFRIKNRVFVLID